MSIRTDGKDANTFAADAVTTVTALHETPASIANAAVGDYWGNATFCRSMYGDICEIVTYPGVLTTLERDKVEAYLLNKWGVRKFPADTSLRKDILPVTTDLMIGEGATLDLAGNVQTVSSLSGSGTIVNSSSRKAKLIILNGALKNFTGVIGDGIDVITTRATFIIFR